MSRYSFGLRALLYNRLLREHPVDGMIVREAMSIEDADAWEEREEFHKEGARVMRVVSHVDVGPASAEAFAVPKGRIVRIADTAGGQPGDFVAFNSHDLSERFSQARTRVEERTCVITAGNRLWTNRLPPRVMFVVAQNNAGPHDLLYTPCCRYALETRFGVSRDGCQENLAKALAPWGLSILDVPDPLNLFFNVIVSPEGKLTIGAHRSEPGTSISLRAEMDCLVAVSACAVPIKGRSNSGFTIEELCE